MMFETPLIKMTPEEQADQIRNNPDEVVYTINDLPRVTGLPVLAIFDEIVQGRLNYFFGGLERVPCVSALDLMNWSRHPETPAGKVEHMLKWLKVRPH